DNAAGAPEQAVILPSAAASPAEFAPAAQSRPARRTRVLIATGTVAALALLGWTLIHSWHRAPESVPAAALATVPSIDADTVARTIAVMPFRNLSRDPDDAFLATGLPEMILN